MSLAHETPLSASTASPRALRNIPDEQFLKFAPQEGREFWEQYLTFLERTPTFSALPVAENG